MKSILMVAVSAALLSACAATGPDTAWGKPGVSKVDYVTDMGTCTAMAALTQGGNAANSAGGTSGQNNPTNNGLPATPGSSSSQAAGAGGATGAPASSAGAAAPVGGSLYRDSTPQDVVNRAANQQQAQVIAAKRARAEALKSCYVEHGYQEFKLTPEQRAHLGTLKQGTNEYLQYLAEIGASPKTQSR